MTAALFRSQVAAVTLGLTLGAPCAALAQQGLGFQAGHASGVGAPLNLLSPTFIAPTPRGAVPPAAGNGQLQHETAALAAPLPLPRPAAAPRVMITQASAPAAIAAGMATLPQAMAAAPAPVEEATTAAPAQVWPDDEPRDRIIIPGAFSRSAARAAEAQEAAALPAAVVAFAAPVPVARPAGEAAIAAAVATPAPAVATAPVLASTSSSPVVLASHGTATTMTIPAAPAGAPPAMAAPVVSTPTPARGPVLASLPPDSGARDWPRFLPGTPGVERNTGIAGERVMPDPGVPLTCLPPVVRRALNDVAMRFGPILVRSTDRGNGRFVRTDDWRGSYHKDCRAADFRVSGNGAAVIAFLRMRPELGGVKRYRNGLIHIDDGPRRSW